jgi:hypothetical protein
VPDADHVAPEQRGRAGVIASELSVSVNTVNTHGNADHQDQVTAAHLDGR